MSMTIDRPTSSTARAECSTRSPAKRLKRPRLRKGAASTEAPARAPALKNSLRCNSFPSLVVGWIVQQTRCLYQRLQVCLAAEIQAQPGLAAQRAKEGGDLVGELGGRAL